jgi:pimeloyl-ACP methyl ester carboxylesterase
MPTADRTPRTITLDRDGATLVGSERGAGPTALLLHAGGERRCVWDQIGETLARRGFRAVAYDLRGHGESSDAGADLLQTHADDAAAMLARETVPPLIVGASLGGLAAMLALASPEARRQVSGVVLVDVIPNLDPSRVRSYLRELGHELADHPIVDDVLGHLGELRAAMRGVEGVPILLVRGGRSPMTDADVKGFLQLVPGARVELVQRAGHLVARDAPSELATFLLALLEADATRRRRIEALLERGAAAATDHRGAPSASRSAARAARSASAAVALAEDELLGQRGARGR